MQSALPLSSRSPRPGKGYRPPGGNMTLCTRCSPETYADQPGSTSCRYCDAGSEPNVVRKGAGVSSGGCGIFFPILSLTSPLRRLSDANWLR